MESLLLGVAALLFRSYLPMTEEIATQNTQLKTLASQLAALPQEATHSSESGTGRIQIQALPEADLSHFGQDLEALARKHGMTLIHLEPDPDRRERLSQYKVSVLPYHLAGKDPVAFAALLADRERLFPEMAVSALSYDKEVGSVEARVLISSQSVRLFAP